MIKAKHVAVFVLILFIIGAGIVYARPIINSNGGSAAGVSPTVSSCPEIAQAVAPWYCNQINQAAAAIWAKWEPIAILVVLASFMLAVIIFTIGVASKNSKIKEFGIGEIYESVATMIIVAMFLFISATMFGILPAITTGNINPYTTALTYIGKNINQTIYLQKIMFNSYMIGSFYASLTLKITVGTFVIPISMLWSLPITVYYLLPVAAISSIVLEALLLLYSEFYMILFFMYASIPVFLIPGIILRAIFPTRSIGGMMMAIAIGFYFLMPVLFAVAFYFTSSSSLAVLYSGAQAIAANGQGSSSISNAISPSSPLVLAIKNIQQGMGAYWMSILFYPALIIAIVYESIMIISEFIGGATKSSGLLRAI
ncbi:MAG: hypothetical protein QW091_00320 [Candidatus Micrarchaeaceae archaeon]